MNYPADVMHWHSYAGENFTDRQRIKRKAERWAANFRDLPPGERLALLSAILGTL
jgi:DNA adenine methylase